MDPVIYSITYPTPVTGPDFRVLLNALPRSMREAPMKFTRWQNAHASLLGKHLLKLALRQQEWSASLDDLLYSSYGRPYLPDGPDFNIAHSGNRVVCIIAGQGKIGIDLEEISNIDLDDFKNQFPPQEWRSIMTSDSPMTTFYQHWTAKECVIKADGRGLSLPLSGLIIENNKIQIDNTLWFLKKIDLFDHYACHIASDRPIGDPVLQELTVARILAQLDL
jgi:4'-phosphopantetheinyl transferase